MLFLGLGTGLGSAMIVDRDLEPIELAHLRYRDRRTFGDASAPPASSTSAGDGDATSMTS